MSGLLDRLFGRRRDRRFTYDEAKELARHEDPQVRGELARREDMRPEILYFLVEDPSPEVRRLIARNGATPRQADRLLAQDADEEVRGDLALKIARLVPDLSASEQDKIRRLTLETLDVLARDEMVRVRRILAETLKDMAEAPPEVIRRLARDDVIEVCAPVLEFSPVLTDADLLEIIESGPVKGALGAISRRATVSERVSDAVVWSDDEEAIASLLGNASAQIREETLDRLIDRAAKVERWHGPLVQRPRLGGQAARKVASFVAEKLLDSLLTRDDLDDQTLAAVRSEVVRRLDREGRGAADADAEAALAERVRLLEAEPGGLTDQLLLEYLVKERAVFEMALALRAEVSRRVVTKILSTHSSKGIAAIVWRAGLTMAFAEKVQRLVIRVASERALKAREDGGFPLSEGDMEWQLELFGDLAR